MKITPEFQVVVTTAKSLRAGDRVLRRATLPRTGKMSVDIASRIQKAPPSRSLKSSRTMEVVWNDNPKNVSFHHASDELLVVGTFVEQKRAKKRFAWQ
jgi:hypothetical protein